MRRRGFRCSRTPAQTENGRITTTARFTNDDPQAVDGRTLYFRVVDPDDASPYEDGTDGGDNGYRGGTEAEMRAQLDPVAVQVGMHEIGGQNIAAAERVYRIDDISGNNYFVEISAFEDFRSILGRSSTFVAWRRIYLETDSAYRKGAAIVSAFTPDADGDPDVLTVSDMTDFPWNPDPDAPRQQITLFTTSASVDREILALDVNAKTITVADLGIELPRFSGVKPKNDDSVYPLPLDGLVAGFGSVRGIAVGDTHTSDGGAFVEFVPGIDGSEPIPKFTGDIGKTFFTDAQVQAGDTVAFTRYWFKNRSQQRGIFQLLAMAPVGYQTQRRDGTIGHPDGYAPLSSHQAMVFWPLGMNAHMVVHEIGHLMGMSHAFPWVDAHVNKPDHAGTGGIDVMSYDSAATDLEFSEDSLTQIRGDFES